MAKRPELHQDIRIQVTALMIRLLCSDKVSDSTGIWAVLENASKYEYLYTTLFATHPSSFKFGSDTRFFKVLSKCLRASDYEIRTQVYSSGWHWIKYDLSLFAQVVNERVVDLKMEGEDYNYAIHMINCIIN